jgi:hypothetical protein
MSTQPDESVVELLERSTEVGAERRDHAGLQA